MTKNLFYFSSSIACHSNVHALLLKTKIVLLLFAAVNLAQPCLNAQSIFELEGPQSMLMTGKGKGQDGAINPYLNENCIAIVENLGENEFEVRIQHKRKLISIQKVKPGKTLEIELLAGHELYFDSDLKSKASLEFKQEE
ncbi:MAG: hypothetical protein AAGA77_16825 [Bacteroidota bacterium]